METRLARIDQLKKKYGATIDEILAFLSQVSTQLSALENSSERRAALTQRIAELEAAFRAKAGQLRALRTRPPANSNGSLKRNSLPWP